VKEGKGRKGGGEGKGVKERPYARPVANLWLRHYPVNHSLNHFLELPQVP